MADSILRILNPNLAILCGRRRSTINGCFRQRTNYLYTVSKHDLLAEIYCEDLPPFIYKPQKKIEITANEDSVINEGLLTNEGLATNEVEDVLYEDYEEEKIEVGYIPTLEEETKSVNVDEDVSGTAFAPPPPPSSDLEFMVPPPVYVSPRNKMKATSSFNLPPPPEYEDLPPPPTSFSSPCRDRPSPDYCGITTATATILA